ncbi:MAG: hypothetical protein IJH40_04030 [Ruminococcus sp.]|uniref:hypothetical protein n=1 Tax=Ruminococcus sp. TaxID=41978 RepID=UPI002873480E|nr:hypothetical protein [Ruminococcus sp.]MBQ3284791.1 hypothetical protein [Ruminococcus sp.]
MYDITKDFINNENGQLMEGFLYDVPQSMIHLLFILREPNCPDEQTFWLKNALHGLTGRGRNGNKILNTFSRLACFALGKQSEDILAECAFINLYPYDGKPRVYRNSGFTKTINAIRTPSDGTIMYHRKDGKEIDITTIADKRIKLFEHLSGTDIRHIVTVGDIFNCISSGDNDPSPERIIKKNGDSFRIGSFKWDERIKVYEYYHPCAPCVNYRLIDEAIAEIISD